MLPTDTGVLDHLEHGLLLAAILPDNDTLVALRATM